jgi:hypothetical protein
MALAATTKPGDTVAISCYVDDGVAPIQYVMTVRGIGDPTVFSTTVWCDHQLANGQHEEMSVPAGVLSNCKAKTA